MAYTKIWKVCSDVKVATDYVTQKKKVNILSVADLEKKIFNSVNDVEEIVVEQNLNSSIDYVSQNIKTDEHRLVTGINCSDTDAAADMQRIKELFNSCNNSLQAYHCVQSFIPGEITPNQAHIIGLKMANELWGDKGYQVLVSTHIDREHIHNHFIINSVSVTGEKDVCSYHKVIAHVSDKLVKEAGYSIINDCDKGLNPSEIVRLSKRCREAKLVVDETLSQAATLDEWIELMQARHYTLSVTTNRQYWTIKHDDWKRPLRLIRLGEDYSNSNILKKIFASPEIYEDRSLNKMEYQTQERFERIKINWKNTLQYKYFIANLKLGVDVRQYKNKKLKNTNNDKEQKARKKLIDKIEYINKNKLQFIDIDPKLSSLNSTINQKVIYQDNLRNQIRSMRRRKMDFSDLQFYLDQISSELESLRYEKKILEEIKTESSVVITNEVDYENENQEVIITHEIN